MLDSNTFHLNNYEHNQVILENQWEASLPEKREAVIEYAQKIMERLVDSKEFAYVFSEYYEDRDFYVDTYVEGFDEALDNWNAGIDPTDEVEYAMLWSIARTALQGASEMLYDVEMDELFDDVKGAIKETINS